MQLLLMEAHGQETGVQAPVLLRCVVAADVQVTSSPRRGCCCCCRCFSPKLKISFLSLHTPRWTPPKTRLLLSSLANRFHLGPPFLLLALDTHLSIIYTTAAAATRIRCQRRRRLFVCDHHHTCFIYLFIISFFFFLVCWFPSKMGGEKKKHLVDVGWRKLVVRARLCLRHEKPREGCSLSLTLPFEERERESSILSRILLLKEQNTEDYCTINHRVTERERESL